MARFVVQKGQSAPVELDHSPSLGMDPPPGPGWAAITAVVDDDGKPGWVQAPDEVRADDTQLYGSGAILLAASGMLDLQRQPNVSQGSGL